MGCLCGMTDYAFGLPPNVNLYLTLPKLRLHAPSHSPPQAAIVLDLGLPKARKS
jgi:hypothetical protein